MQVTPPAAISSSRTRFSTIKQVQSALSDGERRAWGAASSPHLLPSPYLILIQEKKAYSIWQISASEKGNDIQLLLQGDKGSILSWANSLRE